MQDDLQSEAARLRALRDVNPQVSQQEIDYLELQQSELAICFASASLQLAGLRLLVAS